MDAADWVILTAGTIAIAIHLTAIAVLWRSRRKRKC